MNRPYSHSSGNSNNYNNFDYSRRSTTKQGPQHDRKYLDLIEKHRNCKPYLQKRLKIIEESGQLKLLREEVKDLKYWLEIAGNVRADLIHGVDTLEIVHEKMMDYIRLHPIQGAFAAKPVQDSDDDSDSAPRSPSPGISSNDFNSSTRIIPLEQSKEQDFTRPNKGQGQTSSAFLPNPNHPDHRRTMDRSFDAHRNDSNKFSSDWGSNSPILDLESSFSRRGDTDMRLSFEQFAPTDGRPMGRGRGHNRPFDDPPRLGVPDNQIRNSNMNNANVPSSPWDPFRGDRDNRPGRPISREQSSESSRSSYDYRDSRGRSRERSPERSISRYSRDSREQSREREQRGERGRNFYRDQDFRESNKSRDRSRERDRPRSRDQDLDRSRERDGSRERDRSRERDWIRPRDRERSNDLDRSNDGRGGYDYRDKDSRNIDKDRSNERIRHDYGHGDSENLNQTQNKWPNQQMINQQQQQQTQHPQINMGAMNTNFSNMQVPVQVPDGNAATAGFMASMLNPQFMMNPALLGLNPHELQLQNIGMMQHIPNVHQNMNISQTQNLGMMNLGTLNMPPPASSMHINSANPVAMGGGRTVGFGPQSPMNSINPFSQPVNVNASSRPPLLPTPTNLVNAASSQNQNHNLPYQSPAPVPPPIRPAVGPNPFDPRTRQCTPDIDQVRQRAHQHFSRPVRPRPPPPRPPMLSTSNVQQSPRPPPPPTGSNSLTNPNLATNQIAADLPNDPRRRMQLQRLSQQQQQQKQQQQQQQQQKQQQQQQQQQEQQLLQHHHRQTNSDSSGRTTVPPVSATTPVPADPRQRRPSPVKDKDRERTGSRVPSIPPTHQASFGSQRREAFAVTPEVPGLKNHLKQVSERVRDSTAKEVPKTSKLQELRKNLSKQGFHRLGTKGKHTFEEVASPSSSDQHKSTEQVKEKESISKEKEAVSKSKDKPCGNSKEDESPPRSQPSRSSTRELRTRNQTHNDSKSPRGKDKERERKSSQTSEDEKETSDKDRRRYLSRNKSKSPAADDRNDDREGRSRKRSNSGKSPSKSSCGANILSSQKSVLSFRIPKIKKPDPPPPPTPPREPTPPPREPTPPPREPTPPPSEPTPPPREPTPPPREPTPPPRKTSPSPPASPSPASPSPAESPLRESSPPASPPRESFTPTLRSSRKRRPPTPTIPGESIKPHIKIKHEFDDLKDVKDVKDIKVPTETINVKPEQDGEEGTASTAVTSTTTNDESLKPEDCGDSSPSTSTKSSRPEMDTNVLLRQFMVKSVGLTEDVLEQIISNPAAMETIKSLLKSHVSEIVSKDISSGSTPPAKPDANKVEEESHEDTRKQATSPLHVDDGDDVPTRGRSVTRKRAHKRRSSLEKLHDALREMNFDAILPLGPRRAAHVRSQSEEASATTTEPSNSVAQSIQNVIDNVAGAESEEKNETDEVTSEPIMEDSVSSSSKVQQEKGKRGRKRKKPVVVVTTQKKRGRKAGGVTAVTAAAAIAAAAAIPDTETGDKNQSTNSGEKISSSVSSDANSSTGSGTMGTIPEAEIVQPSPPAPSTSNESSADPTELAPPSSQPKRRGRKPKPGGEITKTPVKPTTEPITTRKSLPAREPNPDCRVTRSMIKPIQVPVNTALGKVKIETDYVVPTKIEPVEVANISESESEQAVEVVTLDVPKQAPVVVKAIAPKVTPPATLTPSAPLVPSVTSPSVAPTPSAAAPTLHIPSLPLPPPRTRTPSPVKEPLSPDVNRRVFLYDSVDEKEVYSHILLHDKLLSDAGASVVVKKVFPEGFEGFLNKILSSNDDDLNSKSQMPLLTDTMPPEVRVKECKEVLDWMLEMVLFKTAESEASLTICSDIDDLVDSLYDFSGTSESRSSGIDFVDDEDDDEEDCDNDDSSPNGGGGEEDGSGADMIEVSSINECGSADIPSDVMFNREFEEKSDVGMDDDSDKEYQCNSSPGDSEQENEHEICLRYREDNSGEGESPPDEEDKEFGRKRNLEGHELYRCGNEDCKFTAPSGNAFKQHTLNCFSSDGRLLHCFHCERRLKSIVSLMDHLKIHGKARQRCALCNFRGWFSSELTKHLKNVHKVYNCKVVTELREDEDPVQITYPKEVANKLALPIDLTQNHILYTSKVQFRPHEIDSIPKPCIFSSLVYCALCDYSSKVRSNIVRHLDLHARSEKDGGSTQVPNMAPVNPVPCLERKELMFDKMTNWAGSSHANKIGGVSKEDALKLPKFVIDQFRYVCSVSSCKQITGQDDILCAHMKALHFKEKFYLCPHCQEEDGTKTDLRNTVAIEKIPHHLKLHGPRLSKCGHCDYIHYSSAAMEKHVATKHVEKKPIFYLIRDLDNEGVALNRRASMDDASRGPNERWRCNLCKAHLNCWNDAKSHCSNVHKINDQFECSVCHFGSDSIYSISAHINSKICQKGKSEAQVLIMFFRNEAFEGTESKSEDGVNIPIWRRDAYRVKHIRGIFLDDENTKPYSTTSSIPAPAKFSQPSKPLSASSTISSQSAPKPPPPSPVVLVCPKCNLFKAKTAVDLKIHMFNELSYQRYKCTLCDVRCVTIDSLKAHMNLDHKAVIEDEASCILPINDKIETSVYEMISGLLNAQKTVEDKDGRNIENLLCKHCYIQFSSFHNYRTHILAKHIGTERFKCKYCDAGFWHEAMVRQHHLKSSHADKPVAFTRNKEFEQKLTPDFWFKEYGIPHNKSVKSATIGRPEDEGGKSSTGGIHKCTLCDFSTDTTVALQLHEASHSRDGDARMKRNSVPKRRSVSTTSDTDKEDVEDSVNPTGPKRVMKNFKELSNVYKCDHCVTTNFTKRGIRSHWSRSHGMDELPCRYYECKSFDDNYKLNDGYVLKCNSCPFQTSSVEHYQKHHQVDHPGKPFRLKRRKRFELSKSKTEMASVYICTYCFCECDSLKKYRAHSVQKHAGYPLEFKVIEVHTSPQCDADISGKLIEENVVVECPACTKSCGSVKQFLNHFTSYHDNRPYSEPNIRYTRVYGNSDQDLMVVDPSPRSSPPEPKNPRQTLSIQANNNQNNQESRKSIILTDGDMLGMGLEVEEAQPKIMYECPKCEFKSDSLDSLCSNHLITHLLAYRCPECNVAFHLFLDAQFHIRHFHGISRLRPTHNGDAYVEFSTLKERITQVTIPPPRNVILVNLSDEEDFDDAQASSPLPNPDDLDELDVEDVRKLLE